MILLTAMGRYCQETDRPGWETAVTLSVLALITICALGPMWLAERDREENLRWQAHMRGDHSRCRRKWPCDVPPEGGPPWRDAER